jgi:hypothetical protein
MVKNGKFCLNRWCWFFPGDDVLDMKRKVSDDFGLVAVLTANVSSVGHQFPDCQ